MTVQPADDAPQGPAATVVEAVQAQIDGLGVADERPALVAVVVALAEGLDKPSAQPHHAALARVLVDTLGKLATGSQKRGRLSAVRAMRATGE